MTKGREERKETGALLGQREILALVPAPGVDPVERGYYVLKCLTAFTQYNPFSVRIEIC